MKPTILTFVRYYLPGYKSGGPVRTIANMVDHLGDDFNFRIITSDRDALDDQPYPNVAIDAWNSVGKAQVYYASPGNRSVQAFTKLISETDHDVLYLNSFFDPVFTLRPLFARRLRRLRARPMVIAPRGELSPGALAIKRWKKVPYRYLSRRAGLYRDLIWQASSEHEAKDIHATMGEVAERVFIAPNLPPLIQIVEPSVSEYSRREDGPLQVVFLSRITPMKNLEFALKVLTEVRVPLIFTIYGPRSDLTYWKGCKALISELNKNIQVCYEGEIHPSNVTQALSQHDLFLLPTRGENYGHVIHEALSAGLPVLISDQTPWNEVKEKSAGWAFSLDSIKPFVNVIEEVSGWPREKRRTAARHAFLYAFEKANDSDVLSQNRKLFLNTMAGQAV